MSGETIDINEFKQKAKSSREFVLDRLNAEAHAEVFLESALRLAGKRVGESGADAVEYSSLIGALVVAQAINCQQYALSDRLLGAVNHLGEIAEGLDCLAAHHDNEPGHHPSPYESLVMVESLKASWLKMNPTHSEAEYTAALRRFEQLAGL